VLTAIINRSGRNALASDRGFCQLFNCWIYYVSGWLLQDCWIVKYLVIWLLNYSYNRGLTYDADRYYHRNRGLTYGADRYDHRNRGLTYGAGRYLW